ncbi:hypothetical protein A3C89_01495 [Candidatus Kaiserbacteria bacterium RIFCSPHIGHO2_02_FULL_50_50]|uniref:Hydrolase TatD n=1 Tax=Candidatus Kaiserbacteria bacterium RIFCSPHIGHO2_02_FULL_50_50 TaxID=1798492 RepID=A0A1F6DCA9_9BACT|nr:MAG: hypothetical protein A3C89_01495 [Candidatus Kaiserbacteria bacterium RIFCSPHIGHO2_02_FULL_50_50]OGG89316.1 MAG: hypothetical protein A3G62_01570 [Candidatus Kaiserbacteria bacterium RIFCSPLOWO2_12_FULL_50_10]
MKTTYIDVHTHLNLSVFNDDRDAVTVRMQEAGVTAVNVGTCKTTSERAVALAERYEHCYATVGVHPCDVVATDPDGGVSDSDSDGGGWNYEYFKKLAEHPKVVAIGEIGFDYFHYGDAAETVQYEQDIFTQQIHLAHEVGKPLMLHVRHKRGQRDAYQDTLDVLKTEAEVLGNVHFFAGTVDHAKAFFDIGYTISFTGVITFTKDYDEVVKYAPLDMLHAETDAPFVAPAPYRGTRNEPAHVREVYKKIAELKGLDEEVVRSQLTANAARMFGIVS